MARRSTQRPVPDALALDHYALSRLVHRDHGGAVAAIRRAIEVEPTTAQWQSDLGFFLYAARDTAAALQAVERSIALDPTFFEGHHQLAWIESGRGNVERARDALARARALAGRDYAWSQFAEGLIHVRSGDTAATRAQLGRLDRRPRYAQQAVILNAIGLRDSAALMLHKAYETRDVDLLMAVNAIPELYSLRDHPRFVQLRQRMGVP